MQVVSACRDTPWDFPTFATCLLPTYPLIQDCSTLSHILGHNDSLSMRVLTLTAKCLLRMPVRIPTYPCGQQSIDIQEAPSKPGLQDGAGGLRRRRGAQQSRAATALAASPGTYRP